ncbi:MAG: DUF4136 domain-containing protein [Chitinophagaceae bacterium]|nr:DUF4136 domain-containing protein [Chitinophagaceae bacterium]
MKWKIISSSLLFAAMLATGCSKDPARQLENDENGVYITNRAPGAEFSQYNSFVLADSVVVLENNQLVEKVRTDFDARFINTVASQMESRGFVRVSHGAEADLGITVSRIYNDYTGIVNYNDYWGYYGGYWDPWYWGYPGYNYGYPGFYGVYTITDGAVTVDMIDLKNADANGQLRLIWNGLVRGSGTFNTSRAEAHATALFQQSPYISTP